MRSVRNDFFVGVAVVSLFLLGAFASLRLDSDTGRLEVKTVAIADGNMELSALLYRPNSASAMTPAPAVVAAHGISGSKEMMSGIGLELGRRGFVAICLDLLGHGNSGGTIQEAQEDPSFGVLSAVRYLKSQTFVNASAIGLVGHSLGGGAVRAAFVNDPEIGASVLIAGGIDNATEGPAYGTLNATFPRNLLVIVGKYDVLFNITQLLAEELPSVFGVSGQIVAESLYGNFSSQTARKIITPATTHLFEVVDPSAVSETVAWMENTFRPSNSSSAEIRSNMIYLEREVAILGSLVGFLGIILVLLSEIVHIVKLEPRQGPVRGEHGVLGDWKAFAVWGVLELSLFLPMLLAGLAVSFPPLIFGASIAWWMLSVGLIGFIILVIFLGRFSKVSVSLKATLADACDKRQLLVALALFILAFVVVISLQELFNFNLRIISPLFRSLASARRVFAFLAFVPFFLGYFFVEGLYLHEFLEGTTQRLGVLSSMWSISKVVLGKVAPFLFIICLQYIPMILFDVRVFPSFVGFAVEFLWLIAPIFIITTVCSWFFYKNTGTFLSGAVFNTLMMAWVASATFPF